MPGMLVATVTCAPRKGSIIGGRVPDEDDVFKVICKVSEGYSEMLSGKSGLFILFRKIKIVK